MSRFETCAYTFLGTVWKSWAAIHLCKHSLKRNFTIDTEVWPKVNIIMLIFLLIVVHKIRNIGFIIKKKNIISEVISGYYRMQN